MIRLMEKLWPICRSITGQGLRDSLIILKREIPNLNIFSIASGAQCFDWEVPLEWNIFDAYVLDPEGNKIIDFKKSNLHVLNYSDPVNKTVSLSELQEHLYSLPEQPTAIPYMTSYYKRQWGFCITHQEREKLNEGDYKVVIESSLNEGVLNYGEVFIPGKTSKEIFISTYLCHPSMANNELSGPVVVTEIVKWLNQQIDLNYSYRIVFVPETIGSIAYLSKNLQHLKDNVVAGYNITCIGDDRNYSYLPSRAENTLSDRVALFVLNSIDPNFKKYSYLDRGSDERQYCSPGVDLPVASLMRTKYGQYPEYHTSLDNFDVVTDTGLKGGFELVKLCLEIIEKNKVYKNVILCEPQLGKRGLYPLVGSKNNNALVRDLLNVLIYSDGNYDLIEISKKTNIDFERVVQISTLLATEGILKVL